MDVGAINFEEYFDYEFLYIRNTQLHVFSISMLFPNLKVLDLSCNEITNLDFLLRMPNLKHLGLTCNSIESLYAFPTMKRLESLSLSNNKVSTFKELLTQPELRSISVNNNRIANFEGVPFLPKLERIEMQGNDFCDAKYFRETAATVFTEGVFEKINGEKLSSDEQSIISEVKGRVALATRAGFVPLSATSPSELVDESKNFWVQHQIAKTKDAPLQLLQLDIYGDYLERNPLLFTPVFKVVDTDLKLSCKGMARHVFNVENDNAQSVSVVIEDWNSILLEDSGNGHHSVELLLPCGEYELCYHLDETPTEKEVIVIGEDQEQNVDDSHPGTEKVGYLHVDWSCTSGDGDISPISECHDMQYFAAFDDFGKHVMAEMHFHHNDKLLFSIQDITDEKIAYGSPICMEAAILGIVTEGKTISGSAKYSGGIEGKSEYRWLDAEDNVLSTTHEYKITKSDIGSILCFEFTPVNIEGIRGEAFRVQTDAVEAGFPTIEDISCVDDAPAMEGKEIIISYAYSGGVEGTSEFRWYRTSPQGAMGEEILVNEGTTPAYTPGLDDVNGQLRIACVPVNEVGEKGKEVSFIIPGAVEPELPVVRNMEIVPVDSVEDETLTIQAVYFGGHEGKTIVEWFRLDDAQDTRTLISGADTMVYKLTIQDIGHRIEVRYTPVRDDDVQGNPETVTTSETVKPSAPRCKSLKLNGTFKEGYTVQAHAVYSGGLEGTSIYRFHRSTDEDHLKYELITQGNEPELALALQDVGRKVKVEYIPIRSDNEQGEASEIVSESVVQNGEPGVSNVKIVGEALMEGCELIGKASYAGGIEASRAHKWIRVENETEHEIMDAKSNSYVLRLSDVYYRIKYGCKSTREDNVETEWVYTDVSDEISPLLPSVLSCSIKGNIAEGSLITFLAECNSVTSVDHSMCNWYRVVEEGDETQLIPAGSGLQYHIRVEDIGHRLKASFTPGRRELPETFGETFELHTSIVGAAVPFAAGCMIEGEPNQGGTLTAKTQYHGGQEGDSHYNWFRIDADGNAVPIPEMSGKKTIDVNYESEGCRIRLEYTPVRADGVQGKAVEAITDVVLPVAPTISNLRIEGSCIEGGTITGIGEYSGGEEGESQVQWFSERQKTKVRTMVLEGSLEYTIQLRDTGCRLFLAYTPVRKDGVAGMKGEIDAGIAQATEPTISDVTIVGQPLISKVLALKGEYSGGYEGESHIEWFAGPSKEGPFTSMRTGTERTIAITANDYMSYIRVLITPIRSDGVQGKPVESILQEGVSITPSMRDALHRAVQDVKCSFEVVNATSGVPCQLSVDKKKFVLQEKKKKLLNEPFKGKFDKVLVRVHETMDTRFFVLNAKKKTEIELVANAPSDRDLIVMVMRAYQGLSDVNCVTNVLGAAFAKVWKKAKKPISLGSIPPKSSSSDGSSSNAQTSMEQKRIISALEVLRHCA